jgi:hypothetical protein
MRGARYLLVAAIALGACGDESAPKPEPDVVEEQLAQEVEDETGTKGVVIDCPDDPEEGDLCDVGAAGGVRAKVRITRLEGAVVDGTVVQP